VAKSIYTKFREKKGLLLPMTNKLHARNRIVSTRKLRRKGLLTSNLMLPSMPCGRDL
jgi:hypothetical protein